MSKAALSLVILSCTVAGCGAKVELAKTPIVVSVPGGFVLDTYAHTQYPSLHFELPMGKDGTDPMFPQLSIEQVSTDFHPATADEYVKAWRRSAKDHFTLEPTGTEAGGQPAVEMAAATSAVADVMTSTGMTGERFGLVIHEIVFPHGERYYICKLEIYPEEYDAYVDAVRSLCRSVRFRTEDDAQQTAARDRVSTPNEI